MKPRDGYTLIELAVSMTAGVSLLVMTIGLLHQSMQLATAEKGRADQQRRADRLATEFRRDVHNASDAELVSPQRIELHRESTSTSYEVNGNVVTRRHSSEENSQLQETFELAAETSIDFQVLTSPKRIQMKVTTGNNVNDIRRMDRNVNAVVGRLPSLTLAEESR